MSGKRSTHVFLVLLIVLSMLVSPAVAGAAPPRARLSQAGTPPPPPPARPDSPADAPAGGQGAVSALAAGDTIITFDPSARKARFQVNDGWDLDQYLFSDSSPLDFYIDLKGFKPHPTEPAKVTMRVYDVDQAGAPGYPECQVEVDKVYVNGSYLGDLTGANDQWSIVTFSIPPGTLNDAVNHFYVDIDVLTRNCWAVEVDWAQIEIPFNIAQIEASGLDDVTIKRGKTDDVITDPVWKVAFDANGNITAPSVNDPIADTIRGGLLGLGARELKYRYKIGSWPSGAQPTWEPRVEYAWEIQGSSQTSGGFQELTGWEKDFKVTLPDKVGKYTLAITLKIYHDTDLLRTENRSHTLYVLLNSPVNTTISGVSTGQPRTAWLDLATVWAKDKTNETEVAVALNSAEYGNPIGWGYGYPKESPLTLIEDGAGKNGDCFVFRDVWRVFAAILGVGTSYSEYRPANGFMTSTRPALDGNASANAKNKATGTRDRWLFSNHQFGTFGSTFYDPTYGLTGANTTTGKEANVFCKIDGTEGGRFRCTVLSPPPAKALVKYTSSTINGWTIAEYQTVATSPAPGAAAAAAAGTATFTGVHSDAGYDADGNGLFEHLKVDVEMNVTVAGAFGFMPVLLSSSGDLVAVGSLDPDLSSMAPLLDATLGPGAQTLSFYFNGRAIRDSGTGGPYSVSVELVDEDGNTLDTTTFDTSTYGNLQFQGLLPAVQSVTDSGVDTDATPGYNLLRIAVQADMAAAGNVTVQGQLFAGGSYLGDTTTTASWGAGSQTVNLDFPGVAIAASGLDGPYTVYLTVNDDNYSDSLEHTTAAYSYTAFQLPSAYFTGSASDSGVDTNGNGLYDELVVTAEAIGLVPGTYTVYGILNDGAGNFIGAADATTPLDSTPATVTLHFAGLAINRHGADGPYQVLMTVADGAGLEQDGLSYDTQIYAYTDFEHAGARFANTFTDSGVDTNGDGRYDYLRIAVGVNVVDAGTYVVDGSLHDADGNFIAAARTALFLGAGAQTVYLDFDGRAINEHGVDGPYALRALALDQTGLGNVDSILEAYTTQAYPYTAFQPSGLLLTGNFSDHGEDTNGNTLYDWLVVDMELLITNYDYYFLNARLVDANGREIVWASELLLLAPGTQWVSLYFDGRNIYGNGVDGPYYVKDLSVYGYYSGVSATVQDVYATGPYGWNQFEHAAVVRGTVTAGGQPVPNANVFISGYDTTLTDASGAYRLTLLYEGTYNIQISANPALAPWDIYVNGTLAATGTSASIPVTVGGETEVNFVSTQTGDTTPPEINATVTGQQGNNGWYTGDVTVEWSVSDPESGIASSTGCETITLAADTTGTTLTCSATNGVGLSNSASVTIQLDKTPPTVTVTSVTDGATYILGSVPAAGCETSDATSGVATYATVSISGGGTPSGVGSYTATCSGASDNAGNTNSASVTYSVIYDWSGFFRPVDNLPTLNSVKAGSAIPVKFGLNGNQGLSIFAAGFPVAQVITCDATAPVETIEQTVTAGNSSLTYDASTDQYIYVWKTNKAWDGTCRQLVVKLDDNTSHLANFQLVR
jgi:hypothetical protein